MAKTAAILDIMVKAETARAALELRKFDRQLHSTERSAKRMDVGFDRSQKSLNTFGSRATEANSKMKLLSNAVNVVKFPALIAGAGSAAQALGAAGAGAVALTSALAPLSGLLAAYPALLGAIGQAAGVKMLAGIDDVTGAVGGLNEKLDETSEEFKALSPQAQKFARSLEEAKGPLRDMQSAVQKPLFKGMNEGLDAAMKNLPVLQRVMVATSEVMGNLAKRGGEFLGREGFGRDFEKIGKSNAQLLGRLGTAGLHFGDALRHVMVEARPLIDFLGKGLVTFSGWIEAQAKAGRESGKMAAFFKDTQDVMSNLIEIGGNLGVVLLNIFKAGKPLGDDLLDSLVKASDKFAEWSESAGGQNAIARWFKDAKAPLYEVGKLMRDVVQAFFRLAQPGEGEAGLTNIVRTLRKDLLPSLESIVKTTRDAFGPALIDFLKQVGPAMEVFLGASGPLTIMVESATTLLRLFNKLIDAVPILGDAIAAAFTLKAFGLLGGGGILGGLLGGGKGAAGITAMGLASGNKAGKGFGKGFLGGWQVVAGVAGAASIASSILDSDWRSVGDKAGAALVGGIVGFMAGGPAGAAMGAGAGALMADAFKAGSERLPNAAAVWETLDPKKILDDWQGDTEHAFAFMQDVAKREGAKITVPLIQGWQKAGEVGVNQAAKMIAALKDIQPWAARALAQPGKLGPSLADQQAADMRKLIRQAEDAGQKITKSQVQAWVTSGKISVQEGARILKQMEKVDQKARQSNQAEYVRTGLGFGQAMTRDRKITGQEIELLGNQLKLVPDKYQKAAGAATIAWARHARQRGDITKQEYHTIINTVENGAGKVTEKQIKNQRDLVQGTRDNYSTVNSVINNKTNEATETGRKNSKSLTDAVLRNTARLVDGVGDGLKTNTNNVNKALKGFGVKKQTYVAFEAERANLGGNQKGGIIKALRGTLVPGKGTGDKVPAMLEPGEVVINKKAVAAAGGPKRVNKINRMIPRFATGGAVGDVGGLNAGISGLVGDLISRFGGSVTSGLRSTDSGSLHSTGNAADYVPSDWRGASKAVNTIGSQLMEGIYNPGMFGGSPVSWDSGSQVSPSFWGSEWGNHLDHIHLATTGAGGLGPAFKKLKKMVLKGPAGPLLEMGQSALDKAVAGGNEMLKRLMPSPTHGNMNVSAGGAFDKAELMQLWTGNNGGLADANIMAAIALAESSGNPNAFGPPDGRGLWQIEWGLHPEVHKYGSPYNPAANAKMAGDIYKQSGYSPWVVYNTGAYSQFLQNGGIVQKLQNGGEVEATFGEASAVHGGNGNTGAISIGDAHGLGAGDVTGHGGETPNTPLDKWFKQMIAPDPIKRMTDIIGGIGLRGDRMTKWGTGYSSALDYDEFATMANSATLDDSVTNVTDYGLAGPGFLPAISGLGGETGWLNLELIELFNVREQMVAALPVVDSLSVYVKDKIAQMAHWRKIAHKILDTAKKAEVKLKQKISHLEGQLKKLEQQLGDAKGDAADNLRTRIHDLKDRIGELKDKLPNAAVAISNATVRTDAVDKIKDAFGAKGTELAGFKTSILTGGAEDGSWPSLETLQGRVKNYSVLGELPGLGTLGGDIFRVQLEIRDALTTAQQNAAIGLEEPPTETDAGTVSDSGETAALAAQLAQQQANVAALLAEQAPVFAGFFKQLSATPVFHAGGITPGGMVNTLPGEGIFTQEQMAALGPSNVEVNVSFDGFDVVVDTYVNDVLAKQTRKALTRGPTVGRRTS